MSELRVLQRHDNHGKILGKKFTTALLERSKFTPYSVSKVQRAVDKIHLTIQGEEYDRKIVFESELHLGMKNNNSRTHCIKLITAVALPDKTGWHI